MRAIKRTRSWQQKRTKSAGSPAFESGAVIAAYSKMQSLPAATTLISSTDARHATDATIFACVSAKSLIQKAADARTQVTQRFGTDSLRPLQEREGDISTERTLDDADRKKWPRPHGAVATGSCGRSNPLIRNGFDRTTALTARKRGSFYFVGRPVPLSANQGVLRRPSDAPGSLIRAPDYLIR